ncbi:uncharacterized protein BT62DRAFT_962637 [Guyanagaster necrorhizus]|uniref:protein-tyrosine-phosphatase n=1 Tax=Guyanagaster necrorhizus TaxID=856835 RepID=A0A9P7W2G7_9AGAR|nr:uncharacterized protein BT62DRAFT_962637 [Guyanagaster necrorhizus MCA 3950]KAG7450794.1 hypothetical protein BT62DRAFT_962637 [Guyanagaster necrorhizus MCA 3950]
MDFFSAANDASAVALTQNDTFAQAIASSFGSFTAHLPSVAATSSSTPTPTTKPTLHSNSFHAVHHSELADLVNTPSVLFIDIRPHAQYANARLPNALSLSVPSTLLKRPLFSLDKLASMLSSVSSRSRFLGWNTSAQIIVYDADSASLPDSSNILGLLRKFANDSSGYSGKLCWLQGGFQSVWRDRRELIDQHPLVPDPTASPPPSTSLNPNLLPTAAFRAPKRHSPLYSSLRAGMSMPSLSHQPYNPFFDTIRQNLELSHGITERIPLKLTTHAKQRIADLPFSWLRTIALRTTSDLETDAEESMESLAMQFYRIELAEQRRLMGVMEHHSRESLVHNYSERNGVPVKPFPFSITAGVEKGAKNRYRHIWPFEHARVRLHSDKSISPLLSLDSTTSSDTSPRLTSSSSDTALPLSKPTLPQLSCYEDPDDYVNASYVQPLCTRRRYIATQGPLEATFVDFWTLVWQQNVHVIVMLTREVEGSTVKCNCYWKDGTYGPLHLRLVSREGKEDRGDNLASKQSGGFFNFRAEQAEKSHPIIKRIFMLTHSGYPQAKPRRIVHYQYLEWPDMNVPDDPRGVLELIKEVGKGMEESKQQGDNMHDNNGSAAEDQLLEVDSHTGISRQGQGIQPLLLHCSAGVGRTGGFIAVDAVLDGIRREIRKSVDDQVRTAENKAVDDRTDGDGDILMDETGQRTMPMPPNKGGDILHVPVMDSRLPPSVTIPQRESEGDDTATRQWAENLENIDSTYSRDVGDTEGRSSFETASLSTTSSSEESSFFCRTGANNEIKEIDGEISPNAPSSGYTTSSSFVTTISSEPSSKDGIIGATKKSSPGLNAALGIDFKGLRSARLGEEENHRMRTQSTPLARTEAKDTATTPLTSRSLSPFGSDVKDAKDFAAQSTPNLKLSSASTMQPISAVASTSTTNVDYKDPRPMHRADSPRLLSSCDEPLWEIVQDMREQRMSLCQSLRQYVFVHAAVIEGALMVVDEEKEALGAENVEKMIRQRNGLNHSNAVPSSGPVFVYNDILTPGSSSHGKRGASPTELLKEDKMGELRMSKRPSIKRKQRSHDGEIAIYSAAREPLGERLTLPTFEIGKCYYVTRCRR